MNDWQRLKEPAIRAFVIAHEADDVRDLALRRPPNTGWPHRLILDQIAARQKAARKMPDWLAVPNLVLPPASVVEQASSPATAAYKASLVEGRRFADLTAGAGVDTLALLQSFAAGVAVEADAATAAALAHNLPLLSDRPCAVLAGRAEERLETLGPCDLIYLDPQRRTSGQRGLYRLEDCTPDILALRDRLLALAPAVLLKTSPMLDIDQAATALRSVAAVHVVEWRGECREVLYLLRRDAAAPPSLHAVVLPDDAPDAATGAPFILSFTREAERETMVAFTGPDAFLFEPSPALQKSGGLHTLAARYGLAKLHPQTHLLTGASPLPGFPGRQFAVQGLYQAGGKDLPLRQANVSVRNFPMAAEALRRKLGLRDGGEDTLFACTLHDGRKALIHCRKA